MRLSLFLVFSALLGVSLQAEDVLRFRGHNSQGIYNEPGLLKSWPEGGLTPKWVNSDLGAGWSSVIKVNDRLYLNCIDSDDRKMESVVCLDLDGKKVWQTVTGETWTRSYSASRATPTYVKGEDKLVVQTGSGQVCCLAAKDGKILWKIDLGKMFEGEPSRWGYSESPVVKDGKVFVTPGGKNVSMAALSLKDGSVIWKTPANGDKLAYVTPVLYNNQIIQFTAKYVFGIDTESGKMLWKADYSQETSGRRKGVNCNSPIIKDNHLFVTAGYGQGGIMYEILPDNKGVKILWKTEDLDVHHGGVVLLDGRLYGSNWITSRSGNWVSVDWKTGKTIYNQAWDKLGKGAIISADGLLYIYEERRGNIGLLAPGDKFNVISQFRINFGSKEHWAHPVISDGILYVRHGEALGAFDIRRK